MYGCTEIHSYASYTWTLPGNHGKLRGRWTLQGTFSHGEAQNVWEGLEPDLSRDGERARGNDFPFPNDRLCDFMLHSISKVTYQHARLRFEVMTSLGVHKDEMGIKTKNDTDRRYRLLPSRNLRHYRAHCIWRGRKDFPETIRGHRTARW